MNTVELIQYSLGNAFDILGQVVGDLTREQADWAPPGIANPIGATYWHAVSSVDDIVCQWIKGEDPLRQLDGWQEKVLTVSVPEPRPGEDYGVYMRAIHVDIAVLHAYTKAVAEAVQVWLTSLAPQDLERELETPVGKLGLGSMLETFVVWHVNAHCGEIAALKGCLGAKGYPF
jgi:hypothetical protein